MRFAWPTYLAALLFGILIYFPLFYHLDREPVHHFDEALFAMRAGYMAEEGAYIPNYMEWEEGAPDLRSTKPPFTTWIQAAAMKTGGINELTLRLPVALCALGTVLLLLWFTWREMGDIQIGLATGFVLVTTPGYVMEHAARTGDQDAALAFYMMAGAIAFFLLTEAVDQKTRRYWLAWFAFLLTISVMTKYVFGLFFLPAFFIYGLYKKQIGTILRDGFTWLAMLFLVATVGGWLFVMEHTLPGFVDRTFHHEMVDRYTTTIEDHAAPYMYYFNLMWEGRFQPWLWLLPLPLLQLLRTNRTAKVETGSKSRKRNDFNLLMFLCAASLLLIVMCSQTKTSHYDVVAYPPLAFLAGTGLYGLIRFFTGLWVRRKEVFHRVIAAAGCTILLFFLGYRPYQKVIERTCQYKHTDPNLKYGYVFRKLEKEHPDLKKYTVIRKAFDLQAVFYTGLYNRTKGYDLQTHDFPQYVLNGEYVMACDADILAALQVMYVMEEVTRYEECRVWQVKGKK